jgi:ADP-ribose pyrophosphatase
MELLQSRIVWEGKWRLRVETFRLSDGARYERGFIEHPGAVVVLPVMARQGGGYDVMMIRQYRPALGRAILEVPAGTRDGGESWLSCAQRELQEETGYRAASLMPLGEIWPAPGITDERMALFIAADLTADPRPMDVDEEIATETWPLEELAAMALDGRLEDGKSVVVVLRATQFLNRHSTPLSG